MAEEVDLPPHRLHLRLISSCSHGPAGRSFFMAFVSNRPQAGGYSARLQRFGFSDDLAEISCARRVSVTSSQRNEHVRAFTKSRTRVYCDLRFRRISLGARAECFPAIAPACPPGCQSRGAQLRSDNDRVGQLQLLRSCAVGQRTRPGRSLFQNSGVDSAVGRIAVSWRAHFRARAASALLKR